MNSRKEIKIRAFGFVMENSSENDFQCLVTFWKCYFLTIFSHFLSFQTNFISENFKIYTFNKTKNQNKNIFKTYTWYISGRRSKKEGEIEGTRDRSRKRKIGVDGGQRRPNRMGLGMEWRGLVVGGNQISDVELEGEEELRKKRERRGR